MAMAMAMAAKVVCLVMGMVSIVEGGSWCVAKIDANEEALQRALDSACGGGGADCAPIQPDGLCFIPNTLQAHASYAFNSFYQRNAGAPDACLFADTSAIAQTDPSYGSCVYPSSASTAGVTNTNTTVTTPAMNNPNVPPTRTSTTPIHGGDGAGMNPPIPENSRAPLKTITASFLVFLSSILILSLIPQT
ncbi:PLASMODESMATA CALLOSE-BINDING PROTEIN 3 [Spatholobus suberectus]|nr:PLASMODESMATA CALLOSE-BINDING PROTEIN 3 [Spatholobus suberectus]